MNRIERTLQARSGSRRRHGRRLFAPAIAGAVALQLVVPAATPSTAAPHGATANPVVAWNAVAGEAAIAFCLAPTNDPLDESRKYAMTARLSAWKAM